MDPRFFLTKIKNILFDPVNFFKNLKKEKGIKTAFVYYALISPFSSIIIALKPLRRLYGDMAIPLFLHNKDSAITNLLRNYPLGLLLPFIIAGILYIWLLVLTRKGDYKKTYQLYVYSATPVIFVGLWIPVISHLALIYFTILFAIGLQHSYGLSKKKAISISIIQFIIFYSVFGFLGLSFFFDR